MRRVVQFSTGNVGTTFVGGDHRPTRSGVGRCARRQPGQDRPRRRRIVRAERTDRRHRHRRHRRVDRARRRTASSTPLRARRGRWRPSSRWRSSSPAGTTWSARSMVWLVDSTPSRRLAAGAAGTGVRGRQRLAVCQRNRPRLIRVTHSVHTALSLVTRVRSITVQEIFDYGNYDDDEFTGAAMGFGTTLERRPADGLPARGHHVDVGRAGAQSRRPSRHGTRRGARTFRTLVHTRAHRVHDDDGGARSRWPRFGSPSKGVRDGEPVITLEHVTRLTSAAAPDWEFPPEGHTGVHRVVVDGRAHGWRSTHTCPIRCLIPPTPGASPLPLGRSMRSTGCAAPPAD